MKKIYSLAIIILAATTGMAQSGQKWETNGNAISSADVIGTTNNNPLIFIVNGSQVGKFKKNGDFKINNLKGTNNRMLFADTAGVLNALPQGNATQVLFGDGTWGNLPNVNTFWKQVSNNGIALINPSFFVGIGNTNPQYNLDVTGDIHATNNIYVGGGILVSDKIYANSSVKTDTIISNTGKTTFTSPVKLKFQFEVDGNSIFNAPTVVNSLLNVSGPASFGNTVNVGGNIDASSISFQNGLSGINFTPGNSTDPNIIAFKGGLLPPITSCYRAPANSYITQTSDLIQIYGAYAYSQNHSNVNRMSIGYDGVNDFLEAEGHNLTSTTFPKLLLNYNCGNDVAICTGTGSPGNSYGTGAAGGFVFTGPNLQIGASSSPRNADVALSIGSAGLTAINVQNTGNSNATTFNVSTDGTTLIAGNITNTPLVGTGLRGLFADATGKIVAGAANGAAGSSWVLGGNNSNNASLGTTDGSDLVFIAGGTSGTERMRISGATGNIVLNNDITNTHAQLILKKFTGGGEDPNHGLGVFNTYYNTSSATPVTTVNGPVLYGYQGGALGTSIYWNGTTQVNTTNIALQWNNSGQVFIGSAKPNNSNNHGSLALNVGGGINTTALYVTDPNGKWSDFVFEKNYKLMPLNELEAFYKQNHHLPSVPTTKEIQGNGNNLAETDAILLQKIEELTLYMVQQQKEIEALKVELKNKK